MTPSRTTTKAADPSAAGPGEHSEVGFGQGIGPGDHALGRVGQGQGVELAPVHPANGHAGGGGQVQDLGQRPGRIVARGDGQVMHPAAPGPQEFPHRLAALHLFAPEPGRPGAAGTAGPKWPAGQGWPADRGAGVPTPKGTGSPGHQQGDGESRPPLRVDPAPRAPRPAWP